MEGDVEPIQGALVFLASVSVHRTSSSCDVIIIIILVETVEVPTENFEVLLG